MLDSKTSSLTPSFKSIYAVSGGKQFLQKTLNKSERTELLKLIESQKENPIDITIAHYCDNRLCGTTVFTEETNGVYHRNDYVQRLFFDSPLKFIKRLCNKADNLQEKYKGDIKLQAYVDQFKKQFELTL